MELPSWLPPHAAADGSSAPRRRLVADGGPENGDETDSADHEDGTDEAADSRESEPGDEPDEDATRETAAGDETSGVDRPNVEVGEAGETTPAEPKWDEPDLDEIPEFEIGGQHPTGTASRGEPSAGRTGRQDPTAGRPNEARSPGSSRIRKGGTEGYIVALELCARLPDEVRLPAEAADLVPAAVEAELEEDIQSFAASEFDNPSPTVDTLAFVERDDEVWLQLRLGIPPEAFADLDPDAIRTHALQELEGMF